MRRFTTLAVAVALTGAGAGVAEANNASLRGSRAQMELQNQVAKQHGLAFYRTSAQIHAAVASGELVELPGNEDYDVAPFVGHPFAQPAARLFVERLAAQYREACGQKLVVTSAVRPSNGQPRNAHALSVHPAGMAIDLRVSDRAECRSWLEGTLMSMEAQGLLNGIRENRPPHYHVAIYPEQYMAYAEARMAEEALAAEAAAAEAARVAAAMAAAQPATFFDAADAATSSRALPLLATLAVLLAVPLGRVAVPAGRRALNNRGGRRSTD
jgi:hypothetical protein